MKITPALYSLLCALALLAPRPVAAQGEPIGIVIMHGKGGMPTRHVADLAHALEQKGYLVANLEMPWSGNRNYDVAVSRAEEQVETALASLRVKGARKVFVAGHSLGGLFALHTAGKLAMDGVIAIAPGGSVSSPVFRQKLHGSLARARELTAAGKGGEAAQLEDYEARHGTYPVVAVPAAYVTWFDPEGAMSMPRAARAANPRVPVLWIVPTRDYPGLRKTTPAIFRELPAHPLSRFYEPDSEHLEAPSASTDEIVRWTREVASVRSQ